MRTKKFTIEQIFDSISEILPYLEFKYSQLKRTKKFKEDPIAFPLYCLLVFEQIEKHNIKLKEYEK